MQRTVNGWVLLSLVVPVVLYERRDALRLTLCAPKAGSDGRIVQASQRGGVMARGPDEVIRRVRSRISKIN
ncbi:MAG TPA: hypothetical protein VNH18_20085 [Bryobacteraceae bacterium]|nr:hypothetical protein [Bryobacteraceae bacterium]